MICLQVLTGYVALVSVCFAGELGSAAQGASGDLCAVAVVTAVLNWHGKAVTVEEIEQRLKSGGERGEDEYASMAKMREVIESYGLHARSVKSSLRALRTLPMPAILYIRPERLGQSRVGHVVLLKAVNRDSVEIVEFSNGVGSRTMPLTVLREGWDGELLLVS